jgi:hypothetical protein
MHDRVAGRDLKDTRATLAGKPRKKVTQVIEVESANIVRQTDLEIGEL